MAVKVAAPVTVDGLAFNEVPNAVVVPTANEASPLSVDRFVEPFNVATPFEQDAVPVVVPYTLNFVTEHVEMSLPHAVLRGASSNASCSANSTMHCCSAAACVIPSATNAGTSDSQNCFPDIRLHMLA